MASIRSRRRSIAWEITRDLVLGAVVLSTILVGASVLWIREQLIFFSGAPLL